MYNFEKLIVWQKTITLIKTVYDLTNQLPVQERFALTDQIKRAVTSIALNIAEGSGAKGKREFMVYCRNALKSLYETIAALKIIQSIYPIDVQPALDQCDEISKLLHGLLKYLKSNQTNN